MSESYQQPSQQGKPTAKTEAKPTQLQLFEVFDPKALCTSDFVKN